MAPNDKKARRPKHPKKQKKLQISFDEKQITLFKKHISNQLILGRRLTKKESLEMKSLLFKNASMTPERKFLISRFLLEGNFEMEEAYRRMLPNFVLDVLLEIPDKIEPMPEEQPNIFCIPSFLLNNFYALQSIKHLKIYFKVFVEDFLNKYIFAAFFDFSRFFYWKDDVPQINSLMMIDFDCIPQDLVFPRNWLLRNIEPLTKKEEKMKLIEDFWSRIKDDELLEIEQQLEEEIAKQKDNVVIIN
jgi:hypothetical protein